MSSSSSQSNLPHPHHGPNILPTHRTHIQLPRTVLTSRHMSTIIKQRIDLVLVADATQVLLLVRDFEDHRALAEALAHPKPPGINVASLAVDHAALAVRGVVTPFAAVGVAVGIGHGALVVLVAGNIFTVVGVAVEGDYHAWAVRAAAFEGHGIVGVAEVGEYHVVG